MFETINRTRSGTLNIFWQRIKQSNSMPLETVIGKCARSTNVDMRDNTISSSTLRVVHNIGLEQFGTKSSIILQT